MRQFGLFNRDTVRILTAQALLGLCLDGINSVLSNLYLLRLGYGPTFIGLTVAVMAMGRVVACPLAGALGTRWGCRRPMIIGIIMIVTSVAALSQTQLLPETAREAWVLTFYGGLGVGVGTNIVNMNPFLMDATSARERNHAFAASMAVSPLGGFLGSLVGGVLPRVWANALGLTLRDATPYRYSLLVGPALLILAVPALLATRGVEAKQAALRPVDRGKAPWGVMLMMALVILLRWVGQAPTGAFFNVYLDTSLHVSTELTGTLIAVGRLLSIPAALSMPLIAARWGVYRTFAWGTLGMALSVLPLALIPHWSAAGLGFVGLYSLHALTSPASTIFAQELVPHQWRPTLSGLLNAGVGVGVAAMTLGGGYVIQGLGFRVLFLMGSAGTAACGLVLWLYFRVPRGEYARRKQQVEAAG